MTWTKKKRNLKDKKGVLYRKTDLRLARIYIVVRFWPTQECMYRLPYVCGVEARNYHHPGEQLRALSRCPVARYGIGGGGDDGDAE